MDAISLQRQIEQDIDSGELECALNRTIDLAKTIINGTTSLTSIFGSRKLDALCLAIGAKALASIDSPSLPSHSNDEVIAFVVTEAYRVGGHTRVISDFISAYSHSKIVLIVVDTFHTANHVEIRSVFPDLDIRFAPKHIGSLDRLLWLERILLELQAKHTFVLNHMDDAVIAAALQPSLPTDFYYYHHCDHKFSLGVFAPCARHIDFREQGLANCRHNLGITNNVLIRLVNGELNAGAIRKTFLSSGSLRTCTSGGYKFEEPYLFLLIEMLPVILKSTGGSHVHIGHLTPAAHLAILSGLKELGIDQERFSLIQHVDSLSSAFNEYEVDLYLDSFPTCGCLSLIEAMSAGLPSIVHHNYKSALLSNKSLVYPEAFCWSVPDELYSYLSAIDLETLHEQASKSRQFYESRHTRDSLRIALRDLENAESIPQNVQAVPYVQDEVFEFIEWQQSRHGGSAALAVPSVAAATVECVTDPIADEAVQAGVDLRLLWGALQTVLRASGHEQVNQRSISEFLYWQAARSFTETKDRSLSTLDAIVTTIHGRLDELPEENTNNKRALLSKLLFSLATTSS